MLSVIRVTCSSVDSNLSPTGLTSSVLPTHQHTQAHTQFIHGHAHRAYETNMVMMINISQRISNNKQKQVRTKERQGTFEHPLAQSALTENWIRVIMHTHAHTCMLSHIVLSAHTQWWISLQFALLDNQNLCSLSCIHMSIPTGNNLDKDPRERLIAIVNHLEKNIYLLTSFLPPALLGDLVQAE